MSAKACRGKVAACQGVKMLSPDIFVYYCRCRAECSALKSSSLVSAKACQGKVPVCQGVKMLSPGIFVQERRGRPAIGLLIGPSCAHCAAGFVNSSRCDSDTNFYSPPIVQWPLLQSYFVVISRLVVPRGV